MRQLLSGNEAIARGAYEAGVRVGTGYPGTPSTEILETLATWPDIHSQWSPNEKVALEVALGASWAGARVLVTMKHVGLNVAADPLFTAAYTGVNGGLVVVTADDPGMHSSQNEQDSRYYARAAHLPMLEPADSAEARAFTQAAFDLSERFDTPVLLRTTTRVSHSKSPVTSGDRIAPPARPPRRDPRKWVMVPGNARERRRALEVRLTALAEYAETAPFNQVERRGDDLGVITNGVAYQYVREVAPDASTLKLGMTYPLPAKLLREFAATVKRLVVVEEIGPALETDLRALGLPLETLPQLPAYGELDPALVARALGLSRVEESAPATAPPSPSPYPARPPVMCPGCPHRAVFSLLADMDLTVFGDIGCYSLGVTPPLSAMDTLVCMGAGVGMALGAEKAGYDKPSVAVIGDSTFVHSGVTPLIDIVYNGGNVTLLILDNRTTAMTGRQDHPATGATLMGEAAPELDLAGLCRAVGVKDVVTVDPYLRLVTERAIRHALDFAGPSVVIARRACALNSKETWTKGLRVDPELCANCGICSGLGCPGILPAPDEFGAVTLDPGLCTGCEECVAVCPFHAIGWPDHA